MKLISILLLQTVAMAAGGAHGEASITDLAVPALNFGIVFGFIGWKLKGPMKRMFDENSVKVKELVELASEKDKEAQIKLDMYEKKIANLQSEVDAIIASAKSDSDKFEADYLKEVNETFEKMKKDADNKLESEKNGMLKMLNATLLDEVIAKAKTKIESDNSINKQTTDKILARL